MLNVLKVMPKPRKLMLLLTSVESKLTNFRETLDLWKNGTRRELITGRKT